MVRSGHRREIYDYRAQKEFQDAHVSREQIAIPFIRPAYQALLFAPFSLLPFRLAYFAFLVANLATLVVCFKLLSAYISARGVFSAPGPLSVALVLDNRIATSSKTLNPTMRSQLHWCCRRSIISQYH
jgi:hypothetical protein